jgi:signal transduction histidine kinase
VVSFLVQVPAAVILWWRGYVELPSLIEPRQLLVALGVAALGPAALLLARRLPGPVVVVVTVAALVDLFIGGSTVGPPYVALAFAVLGAVARGARLWAWITVSLAWITAIALGSLVGLDWHPARVAATTFAILLVFGVGEATRTRQERVADLRNRVAQRKQSELQAERVRIARELHDVLAHSLSQINVQAGVGLHLLDKSPEKAADALANIKETSKTALDEVRSVLGILRAEGGAADDAPLVPEPDLSRIPSLAASVERQGIAVIVDDAIVGEPPKAVQLALYRIAQESLTNVVRHAHAGTARVRLSETDGGWALEVTDDGTGPAASAPASGGRGLLGMRERAELLGGHLDAGGSGTGFRVLATIPRTVHG